MITANVIHRVFRIRFNGKEGTAFTIEYKNREYLVTAKHIVEKITSSASIDIFSNGKWIPVSITLVGHSIPNTDISVLSTTKILTGQNLPLVPANEGIIYGQDIFFLGFPYGFYGKIIFGKDGYPLPFVKRATLSLFDGSTFLLDGHNNPGFSGGPVVFKKAGTNEFRVCSVISGYRAVDEPIYYHGKQSNLTYQYNTGIIISFGIELAIDLIKNNPIGYKIR